MIASMNFNYRSSVRTLILTTSALALCLSVGFNNLAFAGLIISFEAPKTISPGLMTTLDVYVQSTDAGNLETLDSFSLKLQITPTFSSIGSLQFVVPQSDAQWTDPAAFANYVFNVPNNDSFNRLNPPIPPDPLPTVISTSLLANDTYVGGDIRNNFNFTVIVPEVPKLLARVDLIASSDALGTFNINVIGDSFTQFYPVDLNNITQGGPDPLILTLPAAAEITAVPEPSSLALLALFGSGYLVRRYRKRT